MISFVYDDNNRLLKTQSSSIARDNSNAMGQSITCIFDKYNQYGDWIDAQCFKDTTVNIGKITRKLEY